MADLAGVSLRVKYVTMGQSVICPSLSPLPFSVITKKAARKRDKKKGKHGPNGYVYVLKAHHHHHHHHYIIISNVINAETVYSFLCRSRAVFFMMATRQL